MTITGNFERFQYFETNFLKTKNLFQKNGIQFFSTRIEITTFPHFHTESAKLRGLRGLVGRVGRVGAWVAWVHKTLAWVSWVAWVEILALVAWVHKILAWVAWVAWVKKMKCSKRKWHGFKCLAI